MKDYERFIPYTSVDLEKISQQFEFYYNEMKFQGDFYSKNYSIVIKESSDYPIQAIDFDFRILYKKDVGCIVYPRLLITDYNSRFAQESGQVYFKSIENRWFATPQNVSQGRNPLNEYDKTLISKWVCLLSADDLEMLRNMCRYKEFTFRWLSDKVIISYQNLNVIEKFINLCDETGVTNQIKGMTSMKTNFENITEFNEHN